MDRIQALCRNFLWEGSESYSKAPLVSWKIICLPTKAGGLGVIDSRIWNIAAVGKLVWWIASKKDLLWIKWIDKIYLKGREWFDYQPNANSSWAWRQVCMVKDKFASGYRNGQWQLQNGHYSIGNGYNWLRQDNLTKVPWFSSVWSRLNTPKHVFNAWLIKHGRLLTMDRLHKMGITDRMTCYLCGTHDEDHAHLIEKCSYTRRCYERMRAWIGALGNGFGSTEQMMKIRHCSGFLRKLLCSLVIAMHYHIWFARNACRVEYKVIHPSFLVKTVIEDGRLALLKYQYYHMSQNDREWCISRGLM
ncbi:uncharacterized protein LOC141648816 [Silene latifolia]|uniref:uncharacterized protein LOC141648816 n=1 Tax=Silene latifolia TaxID=37657 RepID=UPI003D770450